MCEHLQLVEKYVKAHGAKETFRGQAWSDNCREWVYFDYILDANRLKTKFDLPDFVVIHENVDPKSGTELGLVCNQCQDALMGPHPEFSSGKTIG